MRVRVLPYQQHSNSAKMLARGLSAKRLKLINSKFKQRDGDLIINWGNSSFLHQKGTILNKPSAVKVACDKLMTLFTLEAHDIPTVDYTTLKEVAQQWLLEGSTVYARTLLNSHSGKGIALQKPSDMVPDELVGARLYTKAITGKRREFRIHVFMGQVIHCQTKKRKNGWRDNPNYREEIRNKHTGWIYSLDTEHITEDLEMLAVDAINALGLDFGAVDIISKEGKDYILEINTAVGLSNPSTLNSYINNINILINSINK